MRRALVLVMCLLWPGWVTGSGCACYVPIKCLQDADCAAGLACDRGEGKCRALGACQPKAKVQCNPTDGQIYWFDSCGKQGVLAATCPAGCEGDRCKTTQICSNSCDASCECPQGTYCIRALCRPCEQDSDCGTGNTCQAGRCTFQSNKCKAHTDCGVGQVCDSEECVLGTCTKDTECQAGRQCIQNQCKETAQSCQRVEDCTGGQVCKLGKCAACLQDGDCVAGQICRKGGCAATSGCVSKADCAADEICSQGACQTGNCSQNSDCPSKLCVNFICQTGGCSTNGDCPGGDVCVQGKCQQGCQDGTTRCNGTALERCTKANWAPEACPANETCQVNQCAPTKCTSDQDCQAGEICSQRSVCVKTTPCVDGERQCSGPYVQVCRSGQWVLDSVVCKQPQVCEKGVCTTPPPTKCKLDAECPQGQICDAKSFLCSKAECLSDSDCAKGSSCRGGRCCDCDGSKPSECRGRVGPGVPIPSKDGAEYTCEKKCTWVKVKDCGLFACLPGREACTP